MAMLRVTPDEMRGRASEYSNHSNRLKEQVNELVSLMAALQDEWDGDAANSFANQFEQLHPGLLQTVELLSTLSTQLTQTANIYEEADTEIAGKFGI